MAPNNSQKGTAAGRKIPIQRKKTRARTPPDSQQSKISQLLDGDNSRDPLTESRSSHSKRRRLDINGSYSEMEDDDDSVADNTPPPVRVGLDSSRIATISLALFTAAQDYIPIATSQSPTAFSESCKQLSICPPAEPPTSISQADTTSGTHWVRLSRTSSSYCAHPEDRQPTLCGHIQCQKFPPTT
jgi:hypothetical protein